METHVTFILDSSGSMSSIRDDTVGGFNTFLADQRDEPGRATVSLYDFNTSVERVYRGETLKHAPELNADTYRPGGRTALHDALTTAITDTHRHLDQLPTSSRPESVVIVTLTDGKENASETPQEHVRELVKEQREEHGWEFLFIGANQDAALTADQMGMDTQKSLNMSHSGDGTRAAYESTSQRVSETRREGKTVGYTDEDRQRQTDADRS